MNTAPDWLFNIYMDSLVNFSFLFPLRLIVILFFAVLGIVWFFKPHKKQLGKKTLLITLVLIAILLFFRLLNIITGPQILTLTIILTTISFVVFYALVIWWIWRIYKQLRPQKKNRS